MRQHISSLLILICALQNTPKTSADIIFSRSGDDLLVNIDRPISLTATVDISTLGASSRNFAFVVEDVFSTPVVDNAGAVNQAPAASTMMIDGNNSGSVSMSQFVTNAGPFDPTDFHLLYSFTADQDLNVGDTVDISSGVLVGPNFFLQSGARLPDVATSTVQLMSTNFTALSDPVTVSAVPEPSSMIVLATGGMVGLLFRKRHRMIRIVES